MGSSTRGVTTGLAGSAAVLLVAALALSSAHAAGDLHGGKAAATVSGGQVQPAAPRTARAARPAWLRRLLSRSDLERSRKPS